MQESPFLWLGSVGHLVIGAILPHPSPALAAWWFVIALLMAFWMWQCFRVIVDVDATESLGRAEWFTLSLGFCGGIIWAGFVAAPLVGGEFPELVWARPAWWIVVGAVTLFWVGLLSWRRRLPARMNERQDVR